MNECKTLIPIDNGQKRPYMLEVTRQDVLMCGLPPPLHGAVVVHLSDIHGGFGNTDPVYEEAIRQTNAVDPDLILFTGDYIDNNKSVKDYPIQHVLSQFKAKRGVFGSFGNHDHRRGIVSTRRALEQSGIHVLNNESVCLHPGLWLAGVDDLYEGKPDIESALADIPDDVTGIVLSHNPRLIEMTDRNLLILSGHTHGGQLVLPFPTPRMICWLHLRCRQVAGWYRNGRARLYVNRGMGVTGKPFRYNCPAEIGIFRLLPDPAETVKYAKHSKTTSREESRMRRMTRI